MAYFYYGKGLASLPSQASVEQRMKVVLNDPRALRHEIDFLLSKVDEDSSHVIHDEATTRLAYLATRWTCDAMYHGIEEGRALPPEIRNSVYGYVLDSPLERPINVVDSHFEKRRLLGGSTIQREPFSRCHGGGINDRARMWDPPYLLLAHKPTLSGYCATDEDLLGPGVLEEIATVLCSRATFVFSNTTTMSSVLLGDVWDYRVDTAAHITKIVIIKTGRHSVFRTQDLQAIDRLTHPDAQVVVKITTKNRSSETNYRVETKGKLSQRAREGFMEAGSVLWQAVNINRKKVNLAYLPRPPSDLHTPKAVLPWGNSTMTSVPRLTSATDPGPVLATLWSLNEVASWVEKRERRINKKRKRELEV